MDDHKFYKGKSSSVSVAWTCRCQKALGWVTSISLTENKFVCFRFKKKYNFYAEYKLIETF